MTVPEPYADNTWLGTEPGKPWLEFTTTCSLSDKNTLSLVLFNMPWAWFQRPRMKRRAARRIAGYTRTGQRRR